MLLLLNYLKTSIEKNTLKTLVQWDGSREIVVILLRCGPGSSVGIATDYRLYGPGSNPGGDEIFRQTGPGAHPASCKMGTGPFPEV